MNIGFRNEIITTSRKAFGAKKENSNINKESFTQNLINRSKANIEEFKKDEDKRYSVIGAICGIGILAGLGVALLKNNEAIKFFKQKKKYIKPRMIDISSRQAHGGPEIDITKGPKAIAEGWDKYIKDIKARRSKAPTIAKEYKELFAKNAKKLDRLEAYAKERVIQNGGVWA
jgi:hypothetical protein